MFSAEVGASVNTPGALHAILPFDHRDELAALLIDDDVATQAHFDRQRLARIDVNAVRSASSCNGRST